MLVLTLCLTKFVQAYATKNKSARTAANKIYNDLVLRFGFPARLHHDQEETLRMNCVITLKNAVMQFIHIQHLITPKIMDSVSK